MAIDELLLQCGFVGEDIPNDPQFFAKTAKEGPQALLSWVTAPIYAGGMLIARSKDDYPVKPTDGEIVYETYGTPDVTAIADLTCRHETIYYYTAFANLEGMFVLPRRDDGEPLKGASSWAFGGAKPHLESMQERVVGSIAEGSALDMGTESLTLNSPSLADGGAEKGRWVRVGARTKFVDLLLLEVDGEYIRFERWDDPVPMVMGPGTVVELMAQTKSEVAHIAYTRLMRRRIRAQDLKANQPIRLQPTMLEDGQIVAPGQPGSQYGFERYTRTLYSEFALLYSGAAMLPLYIDNDWCPIEALRLKCGMYGRSPLEDDRGHRVREFARVQPHIANWNGAEEKTQKRVEIATGQPTAVRYGADRVIRFGGRNAFGSKGMGFVHGSESVANGAAQNSLLDIYLKAPTGALNGIRIRVYDKAGNAPVEFTILAHDQYGKMILDGDPQAPGQIFYLNYGDSDAVIPVRGGTPITFTAAGNKMILGSGSWTARGVVAKTALIVQGALNATNNNAGVPFLVDKVSTTTNPDDTAELLEGVVVNEGPSSNILVHGGIYGRYLMDVNPTGAYGVSNEFPTVAGVPGYDLINEWVIPNVNDGGGAHGMPRTYEIEANKKHWIRVRSGNMRAGATPNDEYRIFSAYQLLFPRGTRRDRRTSFWNSGAGFFNDCGLAFYVLNALSQEDRLRAGAELVDSKGLTESLYLLSDGTGAARVEVDLA